MKENDEIIAVFWSISVLLFANWWHGRLFTAKYCDFRDHFAPNSCFGPRWSEMYIRRGLQIAIKCKLQLPNTKEKRMWLYALHDHSIHGHVMFVLSNRNGLSIVHYIHISHQFAILLHIQHVKKEIMQFNKKSVKKLRYISLTVHHRPKLVFNDVFVRWFSVRNCK